MELKTKACPRCETTLAPEAVDGSDTKPVSGSVVICAKCGHVGKVGEDGELSSLEPEDFLELPNEQKGKIIEAMMPVLIDMIERVKAREQQEDLPSIPDVLLQRRDTSVKEYERRYVKRGKEYKDVVVLLFRYEDGEITKVETPDIPNGKEGGDLVDRLFASIEDEDFEFNGAFFMAEGWATSLKKRGTESVKDAIKRVGADAIRENQNRAEVLVTKVLLRGHQTVMQPFEIDRSKRELRLFEVRGTISEL